MSALAVACQDCQSIAISFRLKLDIRTFFVRLLFGKMVRSRRTRHEVTREGDK